MKRDLQWKLIDNLKRQLFLQNEVQRLLLASARHSIFINYTHKYYSSFKSNNLSRISSKIQHVNRSLISARSYNILKKFKLSRFEIRSFANAGLLMGMRRARW